MRIVYDGHIFKWQRTGGISRYFREIISRLPAPWCPTLLGVDRATADLPQQPRLESSGSSSLRPRRFSAPLKRVFWRARYLRNAALFHPTYYPLASGFEYSDFRCPVVVTVHDFIGARNPTLEIDSTAVVQQQLAAIRQASHVICVSGATERDLLHFVPEMAGRTSVIYHGSSFPISTEPPPPDVFSPPTFLFVGRRVTYKNFLFLLRAFATACRSHSRIRLHLAGPPPTEEELWQIHFAGISDRIDVTVFPTDAQLREIYRRSVALLYPSRYEGFGIPPLEAMACGTVVISSNATSLPEVVGPAGIMLDPTDEAVWTDQILQIANDQIDRAALIARGFQRASEFTWAKSAAAHVALYERILTAPHARAFNVPSLIRA